MLVSKFDEQIIQYLYIDVSALKKYIVAILTVGPAPQEKTNRHLTNCYFLVPTCHQVAMAHQQVW